MNIDDFNEDDIPFEERWENLTLANDFLFGYVMRDAEICRKMIKIILPEMDIGRVEFSQEQKTFRESIDNRGVRFDVFAKTDDRKIFDCEIQTSEKRDIFKRSRAYHSMIGFEGLNKRQLFKSGSYENLPDAFVIFICTFDPFKMGKHKYTFKNICTEDKSLELNDGAYTIFLNTKSKAQDVSTELEAFLNFMNGKKSPDPFVKELEKRLNFAKQNSEWRRHYLLAFMQRQENIYEGLQQGLAEGIQKGLAEGMQKGLAQGMAQGIQQGMAQGIQQGIPQGRQEANLKIVTHMREAGLNDDEIIKFTGLTREELNSI